MILVNMWEGPVIKPCLHIYY